MTGHFVSLSSQWQVRLTPPAIWKSPRPAEPLAVLGHEGELHQVFTNLMVNAIDAMSASGGRLTLAAENGDTRVRVTVSDDGPGIPDERADRIFQPFFSSKVNCLVVRHDKVNTLIDDKSPWSYGNSRAS